jgi:hypothetical protein
MKYLTKLTLGTEEQEEARSRTRSGGNSPDVTRSVVPHESELKSGLPRVEHQNSKKQQHRLLDAQSVVEA